MRYAAALLLALLAGCSTLPPTPTLEAHQAGVLCTLFSTLTTTVRTVYVQGQPGTVVVGADCSVAVRQ